MRGQEDPLSVLWVCLGFRAWYFGFIWIHPSLTLRVTIAGASSALFEPSVANCVRLSDLLWHQRSSVNWQPISTRSKPFPVDWACLPTSAKNR